MSWCYSERVLRQHARWGIRWSSQRFADASGHRTDLQPHQQSSVTIAEELHAMVLSVAWRANVAFKSHRHAVDAAQNEHMLNESSNIAHALGPSIICKRADRVNCGVYCVPRRDQSQYSHSNKQDGVAAR